MKVLVLGAGTFGCALSATLTDSGNDVHLWSYSQKEVDQLNETRINRNLPDLELSEKIIFTNDLDCVNLCDLVVFVVPSFALRQTAKELNEVMNDKKIIVIATKGLEAKTMKSGHQIIEEEISNSSANVILSGPSHAEELAKKMFTTLVSTSTDKKARELVQKIFTTKYLRVYTNSDVKGVEILGAAKNVLAIAAGICDGHPDLGDNAKAALLTRGLRELKLIGETQDCKADTFYGLTGLGDLMVTANSKYSRNRRFGELLGQGYSTKAALEEVNQVVEGLYSVQAIHDLKQETALELPVIELIYKVIYQDYPITAVLENITARQQKDE